MSGWGKLNQAVTANSTTTVETSNGEPIGVYVNVKGGGGPNAHFGNTSGTRALDDVNLFQNTTPGAFIENQAVGVFGVNTSSVNSSTTHAGWVLKRTGTGALLSLSIVAGGNTYSNTDVGTVASTEAGGNASFSIVTNAAGTITAVTLTNNGNGFVTVAVSNTSVSIANSTGGATTGTGANITATAGGRAGRSTYETLVAMGTVA